MSPQQMQEFLEVSLQDRKLSRSEKSVLSQHLQEAGLNAQALATFRSIAFRVAREAIDAVNGTLIVEWLEDVVKVLQPPSVECESVMSEAWFSPHNDCPQRIRTLLGQARKSVDICVFTITDDRLTSAVLNAHGRGVTVRIITDNEKATDLGSDTDRLLEAGIAVRVDRSEYHMHHKFAVFDNSLLLNGSYNWTRGAAENNEENFIVTSDRRLVTSFIAAFEGLWRQLAGDSPTSR
jgi:phosphatidylserine/phosphatidylglycerophosphate/cardiolipin synthase-like enzyme